MRRTGLVLLALMIAAVGPGIGGASAARSSGTASPRTSDFNGDGYADLVLAAPLESVNGDEAAGAVNVVYGSSGGLTAANDQIWSQDTFGILDGAEIGDFFGSHLAVGDFDADGYGDLAVGAYAEDVGAVIDAGAVNVLYGSEAGLTAAGTQLWTQDTPRIPNFAEEGDEFSAGLGAGDFNGDGFADLAIGARGERFGAAMIAGAVHVLLGSPEGLMAGRNQLWSQDSDGIEDAAEPSDRFGAFLAAGDIDGDSYEDLAIGVVGEDLGTFPDPGFVPDTGAVNVLYGSATGLSALDDQFWHQDSPGILGVAEGEDLLGGVALGDFNADGFADLAVDAFNEGIASADAAGSVNVIFGSPAGLTSEGNEFWSENSPNVADVPEAGDRFGVPTPGDFDGDGYDDLAVGVQGENGGRGALHVLSGSTSGLEAGGAYWTQDSSGVLDVAEEGDFFATNLAAGDLGLGPEDDLAVGVREDLGTKQDAGAANVLYGSSIGISSDGNQFWTQDSAGVEGVAEEGDFFGIPLTAG